MMINEAQNQVASSLYGNPFETFKDRWDGTWEYGLEGYAFGKNHIEEVDAMWARKGRAPQSGADRFATLFAYKFGDTTGVLDMADAGEGRDTYTGEELGTFDRVTRFQRGGTKFASCALMVTGYANGKFNQMSASPFTRTAGPLQPGKPLWKMGPSARGKAIHEMWGEMKPRTFPTIDKMNFDTGRATSIKTADLKLCYQKPGSLLSRLKTDVDKLARFEGASAGGTRVAPWQIRQRELLFIVEKNAASPAQRAAINQARAYSKLKGVKFVNIPAR